MPDLVLPVTEKEWNEALEKSKSKYVTFPENAVVGDVQVREVEVGLVDWDTPGQSIKIPVTVIEEGQDKGKSEKLSLGVLAKAAWKTDPALKALGLSRKTINGKVTITGIDDLVGQKRFGVFNLTEGRKGGDLNAEKVIYVKLTAITMERPATQETIL